MGERRKNCWREELEQKNVRSGLRKRGWPKTVCDNKCWVGGWAGGRVYVQILFWLLLFSQGNSKLEREGGGCWGLEEKGEARTHLSWRVGDGWQETVLWSPGNWTRNSCMFREHGSMIFSSHWGRGKLNIIMAEALPRESPSREMGKKLRTTRQCDHGDWLLQLQLHLSPAGNWILFSKIHMLKP